MMFSKSNIFFLMCVYNVYKCMRGTMYMYEVRTDIIVVMGATQVFRHKKLGPEIAPLVSFSNSLLF